MMAMNCCFWIFQLEIIKQKFQSLLLLLGTCICMPTFLILATYVADAN